MALLRRRRVGQDPPRLVRRRRVRLGPRPLLVGDAKVGPLEVLLKSEDPAVAKSAIVYQTSPAGRGVTHMVLCLSTSRHSWAF